MGIGTGDLVASLMTGTINARPAHRRPVPVASATIESSEPNGAIANCGAGAGSATADSIVADAIGLAQSEALYLAAGRLGQFINEIDDVRILKSLEPRLAPFLKLRFERRLGSLP